MEFFKWGNWGSKESHLTAQPKQIKRDFELEGYWTSDAYGIPIKMMLLILIMVLHDYNPNTLGLRQKD